MRAAPIFLALSACSVLSVTPGADLFPCTADTDCTPYACGPQGYCAIGDAGLVPTLCLLDGGLGEGAACTQSSDCRCPEICSERPSVLTGSSCLLGCSSSADCPAGQLCEGPDGGPAFCADAGR